MATDGTPNSGSVNMQEVLLANLGAIVQQGVIDNQRMSQFQQLAFTKDLMQGGQSETGLILAALSGADRTPVIKVTPGTTVNGTVVK